MQLQSTPVESAIMPARIPRRAYRQKIRTLVPVNLDSAPGGILRDLSEFGIALQTVTPLAPNQQVFLRFDLPSPRVRVEATGRVTWTDSWGQAGVQFIDLAVQSERQLKEWIFGQILCSAYLFAPCESLAIEGDHAEGASELLFSSSPHPTIEIESAQPETIAPPTSTQSDPFADQRNLRFPWCPVPMSVRTLSKLVDGLIQLCAVLLFSVMTMAMINLLPSWPLALALAMGAAVIFTAVYQLLFTFLIGSTPGEHLARLACLELDGRGLREEERSRFR